MKRRACWQFGGAVGALVGVVFLLSCSTVARYRVLSFFFDGVPMPQELVVEAPLEPLPAAGDLQDTDQATTETLGTLPDHPQAERFARRRFAKDAKGFVHGEMKTKECLVCHDVTKGLEAAQEVSREFCDQCHGEQRIEEGWNHATINMGQCVPCHRIGHETPFGHMLDKPVAELCMHCHNEGGEEEIPIHNAESLRIDVKQCTICHDPHRVFLGATASAAEPRPPDLPRAAPQRGRPN